MSDAQAEAALALSYAGLQIFLASLSADAAPPSWIQFTMDRVVFAYVASLCLGSALVCGLVPSWQVSRPDLVAALNDAGRADTGCRGRRWTGAFVVAQVALALVLLTGATLTARNLAGLVRLDTGVADGELLRTAFVLQRSDYTSERRLLFFEQLDERLSSGRGIDAALASNAPMAGAQVRTVRLEGQPAPDSNARPTVSLVDVGERYFDVLGVRSARLWRRRRGPRDRRRHRLRHPGAPRHARESDRRAPVRLIAGAPRRPAGSGARQCG